MIGKSLMTRIVFLVIAIFLTIAFYSYGVPASIMTACYVLIAIRIFFVLTMFYGNKHQSRN